MRYTFTEPVKAIWLSSEYDFDVHLTGFILDGDIWFTIENSGTCLPYEQIAFYDEEIKSIFEEIYNGER